MGMMKQSIGIFLGMMVACATVNASNITLTAHVGDGTGLSFVTAPPGCTIGYTITAETSDALHQGLALLGFDVSFDAGDMIQAVDPLTGVMTAFVKPSGITNPSGYGGTPIAPLVCSDALGNCTGLTVGAACGTGTCALGSIELVQVGGGQNTILNGQTVCALDTECPGTTCVLSTDCNGAGATCVQGKCTFGACIGLVCEQVAPFPTGLVTTGIGMPGMPVDVVSGEITVPLGTPDGVYMLRIKNVFGNVIRTGETGVPFWAVDQAGVGITTNLQVTVDSASSCAGACPQPVPQSWTSIGQHGTGCLFNPSCGGAEYGQDMLAATAYSESRSTGINKIVVVYDVDVDVTGATVSASGCTALDGSATDLTGITMSVVAGANPNEAVMLFSPSLPGNNAAVGETPVKYDITISGVDCAAGGAPIADETRTAWAIFGDANANPITVNNGDLGFVRSARDLILARPAGMQVVDPNAPTGVFEIRSDINNDGTVNNGDLGLVRTARDSVPQPTGLCP